MKKIDFYNDSDLKYIPAKKSIKIAERVFAGENIVAYELNIITVSDDKIHKLNKEYLNHDYATDVITFTLDDEPLTGEIYISAETAMNQATDYKVSLQNEILRLVAHGCLHLAGYNDITDEERENMHLLENKYISPKNV